MKEELVDSDEKDRRTQFVNFYHSIKPPTASIEYFRAIPWLSKRLDDESYELKPMFSRHPKTNTEDAAISQTLNTATTFPHWLQLFHRDVQTLNSGEKFRASTSTRKRHSVMETPPDAVFLIAIGPGALSANAGYVHGGIISLILDNCMSSIITIHCLKLGPEAFTGAPFTAKLEVNFLGPVKCDSNVVVNCWLIAREKNKWTIRAQILDKFGQVLAQGDSLWIILGSKL